MLCFPNGNQGSGHHSVADGWGTWPAASDDMWVSHRLLKRQALAQGQNPSPPCPAGSPKSECTGAVGSRILIPTPSRLIKLSGRGHMDCIHRHTPPHTHTP
ncbi:Hypothetical predicted protein [Marmota monax]|uniref:Uncharacterized protein n=1 Tax=Marmota monax TaxID=9995 RepID=A0A5E4CI65_MARMO|nr:Hypothetical predicted protein [Marmota monax]